MDGWVWERCLILLQSSVADYRESLMTQCACMQMLLSTHMTTGTFHGGYSAMFSSLKEGS